MKRITVITKKAGTTVNLVCPSDKSANKTGITDNNCEVMFNVDETKQYNKAVVAPDSNDHIVSQK